jgi:hypothetical protein
MSIPLHSHDISINIEIHNPNLQFIIGNIQIYQFILLVMDYLSLMGLVILNNNL